MTQDLITTFGKSDGGTHDWKYKGLDPKLSAPEIKEACELLTNLDICTENGVKLFDSVVTAKVVIYKETLIFDPEHETRDVNYYGEKVEKPVEEQRCEAVQNIEVAEEQVESDTMIPSKEKQTKLTPFLPLANDSFKRPHGYQFFKLTTMPNMNAFMKPKKEAFPQVKSANQPEQLIDIAKKYPTDPDQPPIQPENKKTAEHNGLLRWINRIRKRNKDGPEIPRRE
ncbi:hypothetical protein [Enterococcus sp.]|uniref:hypothetical protein n=1 Tax=Enterococcus sp. TaxID=35783 RepID=UPI002908345E|nr:hypothetical protein [Enterococcus sp.]MDU5335086.1 hypothetical protein [Enterococcus sp.]